MTSNDGVYNMVVEVPRWSNAKIEIDTKSPLNPLKQDVKKGKLRFVANCFPHHGYIWNYGAIPQTWEDPNHTDDSTNCKGDNDPIDVCEIGHRIHPRGSVVQVKVLGVFAMIDEGETDWKVIAIDVTNPLAENLNDIHDVDKIMPGFLKATVEWFKIYKMPDGKPAHESWKKLMAGTTDAGGLNLNNTTLDNPHSLGQDKASELISQLPEQGEDESLPEDVNKWHYVSLK